MKQVHVWEDSVDIPTYGVGTPNKNPMFLEKRVYQGSSGKVYPFPMIDKILDEKKLLPHKLLFLENDYLHIEIMPDLGGRIYRATDKTNGYDFVYYNQVIKPALVGLAGPWISGGIEFNWPQHHRPNTYGPVTYAIQENADGNGSATIWISEIDRMYGTKMTAGFTLYPDKAYLEIDVRLYNRTDLPQTFLWWANPAIEANEHTQTIFPPDVHSVFDHGKRDVSRFPIATGTYYKIDYTAGVDISWHQNIPVPTSYMAHHSDYDFLGGYNHALQAGVLHIADHHISPGKKQWTWGNGDFGHAWDRNLTDENGSYVELMSGVYTDNQPDFSWLHPFEEKSFKQYFLPYKKIGVVKNASIDAALNLELDEQQQQACIQVYVTASMTVTIELHSKTNHYLHETIHLTPDDAFSTTIDLEPGELMYDLQAVVKNDTGKILVKYQPEKPDLQPLPVAAQALPPAQEMRTNEALYLAGLHLEQYRHATFDPVEYYQEGLRRDPGDSRINLAYGKLLLQRGLLQESENLFRQAITTLTRYNPNPYDGEASYQLGINLKLQGRYGEACTALYKAAWSAPWQASAFVLLAQIKCIQAAYDEALHLIDQALEQNQKNSRAAHLKSLLLRKLGRDSTAIQEAHRLIQKDPTCFGAYYELFLLYQQAGDTIQADKLSQQLNHLLRADPYTILALAHEYSSCGCYAESLALLQQASKEPSQQTLPMIYYFLGDYAVRLGDRASAHLYRAQAEEANPDYCFPNSLEDLLVLEETLKAEPASARAHYYLGNLLYDKQRPDDAIKHWEHALTSGFNSAIVQRNLALAYYNKKHDPQRARVLLEQACISDPDDARLLYELDQLHKRLNDGLQKRLDHLHSHWALVQERDDLYLEYVTLLNQLGHYEKALDLLLQRHFHPWEGGEGKVTGQYVQALVAIARQHLQNQQPQQAIEKLTQALTFPDNLGEGKLAGTHDNNIYYYLGCAYAQLQMKEQATASFHKATQGFLQPGNTFFYNDQPPDMLFYQGLAWRKLGNEQQALSCFHILINYGEQHLFEDVKIDYFAVSLPDFLIFDDDLTQRNVAHCHYMLGLGYLGIKKYTEAATEFKKVLELNTSHQGARHHLLLIDDQR